MRTGSKAEGAKGVNKDSDPGLNKLQLLGTYGWNCALSCETERSLCDKLGESSTGNWNVSALFQQAKPVVEEPGMALHA